MPVEEAIMSYIDQANIACGYHAGDPIVMKKAITLAKQAGVSIGAHPAYPDLQGFGRRSMVIPPDDVKAMIQYQVGALCGLATSQGCSVDYVKPHGALYNDLLKNKRLCLAVMAAVSEIGQGRMALMIQATPHREVLAKEAKGFSLPLMFEAFADRRYTDEGLLTPRDQPGAVLNAQEAEAQVELMISKGVVITESGKQLALKADTLCVHGDSPGAIEMAARFSHLLRIV